MRRYYATEYVYGKGTIYADTGRAARTVYQFTAKRTRDEFVKRRATDYTGANGYREALRRAELTWRERAELLNRDDSDERGYPVAVRQGGDA